jgi:hypothetical protein
MNSKAELEAAIASPLFSHARAGDRLYRGATLIYHRHPTSPSGVVLACIGEAAIADPLIRAMQRTSPLSPTEGRA